MCLLLCSSGIIREPNRRFHHVVHTHHLGGTTTSTNRTDVRTNHGRENAAPGARLRLRVRLRRRVRRFRRRRRRGEPNGPDGRAVFDRRIEESNRKPIQRAIHHGGVRDATGGT